MLVRLGRAFCCCFGPAHTTLLADIDTYDDHVVYFEEASPTLE